MTLSVHEIAHAFAYGQSFGEIRSINIVRMRVALASGAITVQTEAAQPHHWFNGDDETWRARHRFASQFSGQTDDHRYICANAARWLESEGFKWTARDLNYPGGIADVAVPESQIAVECGYTNAEKVLDGCSRGWTMIVMPYSAEVAAHVFTPSAGSCGSIDALFGKLPREDQIPWWRQAFNEMKPLNEREPRKRRECQKRSSSTPRVHKHECPRGCESVPADNIATMMALVREMGERGAELFANQPEPIPQAYPRDFTYARTKAWEQDETRFDDVRTDEMIAAFEGAGRVTVKWEPK